MNGQAAFWVVVVGAAAVISLGASLAPRSSPSAAPPVNPAAAPAAAAAAHAPPTQSWKVAERRDDMRGTRWWAATLRSANEVFLDFPYHGGSHAELVLIRNPSYSADNEALRVWLSKGQISCHEPGAPINVCSVAVRFDDGPVMKVTGRKRDAGTQDMLELDTYPGGPSSLIAQIEKAKRMVVELPLYRAGDRQFTFNVPELRWPEPRPAQAAR